MLHWGLASAWQRNALPVHGMLHCVLCVLCVLLTRPATFAVIGGTLAGQGLWHRAPPAHQTYLRSAGAQLEQWGLSSIRSVLFKSYSEKPLFLQRLLI